VEGEVLLGLHSAPRREGPEEEVVGRAEQLVQNVNFAHFCEDKY
jgi:hypothetical protein